VNFGANEGCKIYLKDTQLLEIRNIPYFALFFLLPFLPFLCLVFISFIFPSRLYLPVLYVSTYFASTPPSALDSLYVG